MSLGQWASIIVQITFIRIEARPIHAVVPPAAGQPVEGHIHCPDVFVRYTQALSEPDHGQGQPSADNEYLAPQELKRRHQLTPVGHFVGAVQAFNGPKIGPGGA